MNTSDSKKKMIEALEKNLGIVSVASSNANIHRSTHYLWYSEDEEYKKQVDEIHNVCLDFAESKLFENIKDNKETSTIFYLKTRGKNRGYVERQEIDTGNNNSFRVEIIDNLDEETTD
tara:strand:- start:482 stop:835 length:354 start_codon:yes stop_codon:yes gene_type:complete